MPKIMTILDKKTKFHEQIGNDQKEYFVQHIVVGINVILFPNRVRKL